MLYLISLTVIGIVFALFATQNTQLTQLYLGNLPLPELPTYMVVLGSLLIGFVVAGLVGGVHSFSFYQRLRGRDQAIRDQRHDLLRLKQRVHNLESENSSLKHKLSSTTDSESLIDRLNRRFQTH